MTSVPWKRNCMDDEKITFRQMDEDPHVHYVKKVLSNRQCCMFFVIENKRYHETEYTIAFAIANKFKTIKRWLFNMGNGDLDITSTGRCGLEGLYWARECLKEAIRHFDIDNRPGTHIDVAGTDGKRYRVYRRYLLPLGFRECRSNWGYMYLRYEKGTEE